MCTSRDARAGMYGAMYGSCHTQAIVLSRATPYLVVERRVAVQSDCSWLKP